MSKQVANPDAATLAAQIEQAIATSPAVSGDIAFMKFAKGEWLYGADEDEAATTSLWAVNPKSFCQGYIVWGDNEVEDEQMAQLGQPAPSMPAGADAQVAFEMLCIEGEDEGTRVLFKTSSKGGRKAVMKLIKAVGLQSKEGQPFVPVCLLDKDSYKHKEFGKIYTPVFTVEEWINESDIGTPAEPEEVEPEEVEPEPEKEEEEAPKRRRRRAS